MNLKLPLLVLIFSLSMPLARAGQNPANKPRNATENNGQISSSDKSFLQALIQEDMSEIQLAHLALQKSSSPEVKQYANSKILAADPDMRDRAEQIAKQYGMTPPKGPNARQDQTYGKLAKQSGKLFDNAYMNYEADQQSADVNLVQAEINSTDNPTVKSYAQTEELPVKQAASSAVDLSTKISTKMTDYRQPDNGGDPGQP